MITTFSIHVTFVEITEVQILYCKIFDFGLGCSFRKLKEIPSKISLFLTIGTVNKDIRCKRKFCRELWS